MPEQIPPETTEVILNNSPLLTNLSNLNDSLIASRPSTRSFWSIFKKVCSIAVCDIKGAWIGAKLGSVFGPHGATIGATVLGIGSSAHAGFELFKSRSIDPICQDDIEAAYVFTITDPDLERNKNRFGRNLRLNIPIDQTQCEEIGKLHNLTLDAIKNNNFTLDYPAGTFSDSELEVIHSEYFRSNYIAYMSNDASFDLDLILDNYNNEDYIVKLFLDIYNNYPSNLEDVEYIINEYIRVIENDATLTSEEKAMLYTALAIAGYSTEYWEQQLSE